MTSLPDFALVNQNTKPIRTGQYKGKTLLFTFIYTRCPSPSIARSMSNNFSQIDRELQKQPEVYDKDPIVEYQHRPDYDTPAVLSSYGASHTGRFGEETFGHWTFATGSKRPSKGRGPVLWTAVLSG